MLQEDRRLALGRYSVCMIECDADVLGNGVTTAPSMAFYIYYLNPPRPGTGMAYRNDLPD